MTVSLEVELNCILRPTYTYKGQLLSGDFVVQQRLQIALNFPLRNLHHVASDKKRSRYSQGCGHFR